MAVVLFEGFDHFAAGQAAAKGWGAAPSSMQLGRWGGQCWRAAAALAGRTKALPATYTTLFCGFAFRASAVSGNFDLVILAAGSTQTFRIGVQAGLLQIRNSSSTVIATGTTSLVANTWYYVEVKAVINGASGTCELHLNGASGEIATTTGNFGSTAIDHIILPGVASINVDIDDIYAVDTTGSAPENTFLGDTRVGTPMPTGAAGTHSQWTANGASPNAACVNETTPDDDVTYISDATPGHIDTYPFAGIDGGATVFAVKPVIYARKDDAATRQVAPVIRQGGTDYVGGTFTLGSTYLFFEEIHPLDPTGAAWTPATVNGDEFGVKEIA